MTVCKLISLAGLAFAVVAAQAQSGPPVSVVVDGQPVVFPEQQPGESNGRVLVPLRGVFERLGASVGWNPSTQTVTARKGRIVVRLTIGQLDASVDSRPVHMDVPATLVGGSTMVPLRFVSEALGAYVGWNPGAHEVDITSSKNYDIPRRDDHRDDHRIVPPPRRVVVPPPPPRREPDRRPLAVLQADTVIPFTLSTRLSSVNAQVNDAFTVQLNTYNQQWYDGLPAGTIGYGKVSFVRRQQGRDPGLIELRFDQIVLPNGRHISVNGRLIGMDDASVMRGQGGIWVPKDRDRGGRPMFTGFGAGPGVVLGLHLNVPLGSNRLSSALGIELGNQHARRPDVRWDRPHDVELRPGTPLGLRLFQNVVIPR